MPSISQPFRLTALPKIASLNNYASQANLLQVADTLTPSTNYINVGISGSAISQYVINPTPKLVYNLPISSTNVVNACDVAQLEDDEVWCYALQANKTFSIHCLQKPVSSAPASDSHFGETYASNKIAVSDQPVSVKVIGAKKTIVTVLRSGLVQFYDYSLKLQYSFDSSYKNVQFVQHFTNESKQDFVFILSDIQGKKVSFKLLELAQPDAAVPAKELSSVILEDFQLKNSEIFYQFGKIYRLHGKSIDVYTLPYFQHSHTISLPFLSKGETSFKPISQNRALLTCDNQLYLLDLLHNAILSHRELTHVKTFQLLTTAVVPGNFSANNKTIAIGVSTKHGANPTSSLDIVNIDVGTGTLKDSMGKGFSPQNTKSKHLQPLLDENSDVENYEYDYDQILEQLRKAAGNVDKFDSIFFPKLGIKQDYYTESDRFINDQNFLRNVASTIFENFNSQYPKALPYLLTHPLFPKSHTQDILQRLKDHPRLFKQAIVTCPNLSLDELLQELFTVLNDELCLDLSLRILQDFNKDIIKETIKTKSKIDVNNFISFVMNDNIDEDRIKNKPRLFQLLNLVLDSVGLFSLGDETLAKLSDYIEQQLKVVKQNVELFNLLEDKNIKNISNQNQTDVSASNEGIIAAYSIEQLEL
ncbi:LANO_0H21154g1_1 [Lachancea nothofagi CBS 11611]|uniref:LANO_0H21154g1_1 n=1 Tax=Lachancea nothofagi CBS 11611 TaxID=1266666 RepID=A0A1G4KNR1_9SACH|nr:LANO_0H21154g1_1 [Lachancea nothofagi CBS 11611]